MTHACTDSPLYLISVDMDGTVVAPNQKLSGIYERFLRALQKLPRIEIVLNSGKSVQYLEREAARINARYVIANNGAAMSARGVIGVTFPEADLEKVIKPVLKHGGFVTSRPAWLHKGTKTFTAGGGVIERIQTLAYKGFFGDHEERVLTICARFLGEFEKNTP